MTGVLGKVTGWMSSPSAKLRRAQRLLDEGHRAEAFPLLARVAQTGNAEAEFLVARAYLEGSGVPPNATEAARWLERAAERGYLQAQSMLAALYMHGINGAPPSAGGGAESGDRLAAVTNVSELAASRPTTALFAASNTAEPDFERAALWARRAAAGGSADGEAILGFILTSGPESLRDLDEAEVLYR